MWFSHGAAAMAEHLNSELFNELKDIMEEEFPLLLETYLRDSQLQYQRIDEAWKRQSMDEMRRSAHSLKGSSANIGAEQLAALCAELESKAKESDQTRMAAAVDAVSVELAAVRQTVSGIYDACR